MNVCLVYREGLTELELVDGMVFIIDKYEVISQSNLPNKPKEGIVWKSNLVYNETNGRLINLDIEEEQLFSKNSLRRQIIGIITNPVTKALSRTTIEEDLAEMEHDKEVMRWWRKKQ